MKTTRQLILSIIFLAITFYSCSSDDDSGQKQEDYFITAKIDGVDFTSDFPVLLVIDPTFSVGGANDSNNTTLQIFVKEYNGPGTYTAGGNEDNGNTFGIIGDAVYITDGQSGSGTLTINEDGNSITGTFSFTAINTIENSSINVTEGSFRVLKLK